MTRFIIIFKIIQHVYGYLIILTNHFFYQGTDVLLQDLNIFWLILGRRLQSPFIFFGDVCGSYKNFTLTKIKEH